MKLADVCRLCLTKSTKSNDEVFFPINIFEDQFWEITNLKLAKPRTAEDESKFPDMVCGSCATEIDQHINYRSGLIQRQLRLNAMLGVRNESMEEPTAEVSPKNPSDCKDQDPEEGSDQEGDVENAELQELEDEMEHKHPNVKTEEVDTQYEAIYDDETYGNYEEQSQEGEFEFLDDNTTASDTEEINESVHEDDDEEEVETVDQLEEDYELDEDPEDYRLCYVKAEDSVSADENFVVFEQDIAMEEVIQPATKRKYTKHAKDAPRQFKCWVKACGATFSFRATMKKHMQQLHSILCLKSTCFVCGNNYECYADFLAHMKLHTRKSQCDVCKLTFVDDEKMLRHKAKIHKIQDLAGRSFQCPKCDARFKRKEHLNSHTIYKHSDKDARKFPCKECSSCFLTRQDLKNHEKSHSQVKIYCIYCPYNCRDLKSIKRHCIKKHNTTSIYQCVSCEQKFEAYREFTSHKKLCAGESIIIESV